VIDSLCDQERNEGIAVACFYCDFLAQQEHTTVNMMGAILKQLVGRKAIPTDLRQAFQEGKKKAGGRRLLLADLIQHLKIAIASLSRVFICIDALDESPVSHLPELVDSLGDIARGSPKARIFLTGRPHVQEAIRSYFARAVVIPIIPDTGDIRNYLEMRLEKDVEPEAMTDGLRADIIRIIQENISNMCVGAFGISGVNDVCLPTIVSRFLLVSLNMDAILGEVTIRQRRKKLEEIARGNGLSDAYTETIKRLKSQGGNRSMLGVQVLMWVLYAERPLRAEELCHALGVEIGSADMDPENFPALRTLLESCLGLVTVETSSSTVRLVHFTLQEHLLSDPTVFSSPHSAIAEVCLTYLNFQSVRDLSPTLHSAPLEMPFLEYASCYWGKHARMGMTDNVKRLALRLLDGFDSHLSAKLLLLYWYRRGGSGRDIDRAAVPAGFTGLHGVSFFGIAEIATAVLEMKEWDLNATDCTGGTALTWAARRGHEEVVKILLELEDIGPIRADTHHSEPPHSWAALHRSEETAKLLLERGANPDAVSRYCQTASAALRLQEGMTGILLESKEFNNNLRDSILGRAPHTWVAPVGREGGVKALLEPENVSPQQVDGFYDRTPPWFAARNGYEEVLKNLLRPVGVDPNQANTKYYQMPLPLAAERGHGSVVKKLLKGGGLNPDQPDTKYGRTPLSWAAERGQEGVVKMLLQRENVDPNTIDTSNGRTPLSWAALRGCVGVVKVLLERQDVYVALPDMNNQTPLSLALSEGHDEIVEILLGNSGSRAVDHSGQALLLASSRNGDECAVDMQFRDRDSNSDIAGINTPLVLPSAIVNGQEGVSDPKDPPPSTKPPTLPQRFMWLLKFWSPHRKTDSDTNNPRPTLSLALYRYFLIASFICLLAFLVCVLPSPIPHVFSHNE